MRDFLMFQHTFMMDFYGYYYIFMRDFGRESHLHLRQ